MVNVWRIHLQESPNYGEYCLKNNIAAMGWILEKYNDKIQSGEIKIENYADYASYAKKCHDKFNDVHRLAEEVKPGDFIWTCVNGKYYLAKVSSESKYHYNFSDEAIKYRACNELTNIFWKFVGERKDIDEKICKKMEGYQTFRRLVQENDPDLSAFLGYSDEIYEKISL